MLADNKLAMNAGWDKEILAIELQALIDVEFDVTLTGSSLAEVDLTLDQAREASVEERGDADKVPQVPVHAVTHSGGLVGVGAPSPALR
ncbi:hypothetical protein [Xanthobacter sp. KR7-225]|uniref:hypothetical protein n=1 Tax=Xanthobacter sp. KR7-225 TaxID=3156613 RepID=UPI0032B32C5F